MRFETAAGRVAYAWYVAGVLSLTNFFSSIDRFITGVLMVPIKASLNLNDTQVGLIQGLGFALLYSVLTLPMGRLADRVSRRNTILWGTLAWTIATASCALAHSFPALFTARLATGVGEATLLPGSMSLLATYFERQQVGRAISVYSMGASFGKGVSFIVGGMLLTGLQATGGMTLLSHRLEPWQAAFLIAGAAGLPLAALQLTVREPSRHVGHKAPTQFAQAWAYFLAHRQAYVLHTVCGTSVLTIAVIFAAWGPSFFVRGFGLNVARAGLIVGVTSLIASPSMLLGGYAVDRLNDRGVHGAPGLVMGICCAACVPCIAAFTLGGRLDYAVGAYLLAQILIYIAAQPAFIALQLMSPPQHRGLITAVFFGISSIISSGCGPPLIGLLSDTVFHGDVASLAKAILVTVVPLAAVTLATGLIREPFSRAAAFQAATQRRTEF